MWLPKVNQFLAQYGMVSDIFVFDFNTNEYVMQLRIFDLQMYKTRGLTDQAPDDDEVNAEEEDEEEEEGQASGFCGF